VDPASVVDGQIVEAGVGTVMQMIRRDALVTAYRTDWQTCTAVNRAGWRVGWAREMRAVHLGWDDYRLYPAHLAAKHLSYGDYREMELVGRPPTLTELALAAPILSLTRAQAVPDASVLELTWGDPAVGPAVPESVSVAHPDPERLPFADEAAGAVVLVDPPARESGRAVAEATRVATAMVVAIADLKSFGGRTAQELAPPGWTGEEARGPGDLPLSLARLADAGAAAGVTTLEDRAAWLRLFAASTFGTGTRRLWIWRCQEPGPIPERVRFDERAVKPWVPTSAPGPAARRPGPLRRVWKRADLLERARVWSALRRRASGARA
jgi:hypothetical protein